MSLLGRQLIATRTKVVIGTRYQKGPGVGSSWTMTLASPSHSSSFSLYCRSSKNIKIHPFSYPWMVGSRWILPQGMTFRPCCLDSAPGAVFPTFWWGGIWPGASANAVLSRSTFHLFIPFFFQLPFLPTTRTYHPSSSPHSDSRYR